MANSRIVIVCKHCGEQLYIGKGYFGYYSASDNLTEKFDNFFEKHKYGECSDDIDCSDDAKNHFAILEKGDSLEDLYKVESVRQEVAREILNAFASFRALSPNFCKVYNEFEKKYIGE